MAKSKHKRTPRTVLKLPDLEQSKSAVMNSQTCGTEPNIMPNSPGSDDLICLPHGL